MERQDDKPRAYPDGEGGRRDEAVPQERPAAADASREYTDTGREGTDRNYVDPGGEYSESGRDESVESVPTSETEPGRHAGSEEYAGRQRSTEAEDPSRSESGHDAGPETRGERENYAEGEPGGAASTATTESAEESRTGASTESQAYAGPADQPTGAGTSRSEAAYDAATERQAVTPPDAEARSTDATAAEGRGDQAALGTQAAPGAVTFAEQTAVLSPDDARTFQARWETIQGTFIDDPHAATEQADALVGEVMERLVRLREDYLRQLRGALSDGSDTEAMRVALQRYRAFFQMLLG
ncbi:MAG: hypothetical protein M3Z97_05445 [Candidatus Dormibacteraeota bacterium]|nr:hypothetical protein [Candidatus Dormibacteraeota bacterium]